MTQMAFRLRISCYFYSTNRNLKNVEGTVEFEKKLDLFQTINQRVCLYSISSISSISPDSLISVNSKRGILFVLFILFR